MKDIKAVRITNGTNTGNVVITIVLEDKDGNRTKYNTVAITEKDPWTKEKIYHADTKELDDAMQNFIKTATKTEKTINDKWAYIYK